MVAAPKPASLPHFKALVPWLGSGLLLSGGKHWERNRKLINPAFHLGILRTYLDVYNNAANIMVVSRMIISLDVNHDYVLRNLPSEIGVILRYF